jgi:hypothetical protein
MAPDVVETPDGIRKNAFVPDGRPISRAHFQIILKTYHFPGVGVP